jgi:carbonic anhydrase
MKNLSAKNFLVLAACGLLTMAAPVMASEHGGAHGEAASATTPQATIKKIIQGNDAFMHDHQKNHFDSFQGGQIPAITVISCADSRVHTHLFDFEPDNNIFIIRNVGNQIENSEGSVDYGVRHVPAKVLLVMGHSSCGAVKAAMGDYSGETAGIKAELDTLKPVMAMDDQQGPFNDRWAKNVERNVDFQVKKAMELYGDKIGAGELAVVGAVYDFNDLWGKGRGALVVVNVNGVTKPQEIMNHPALNELSKAEIVTHVGSHAE